MASHNVPRAATIEERTPQQLAQDKATIDKYRGLVSDIEQRVRQNNLDSEVLDLTTAVLKQNPEYYTVWNVRRRILTSGISSTSLALSLPSKVSPNTGKTSDRNPFFDVSSSSTVSTSTDSSTTLPSLAHPQIGRSGTTLEVIQKELAFVFPLLKAWPKCYWIWNHRVWLLNLAKQILEVEVARTLWEGELKLVGMMLVRDNRNFHGWSYRRMVVEQLESDKLNGTSMVEQEFAYTTSMFKANLSNFSAWHYRSMLIPRLLAERKANAEQRREFLDSEFRIIRDAYWTDPDDQSIWFYHQYLMSDVIDYHGLSNMSINLTTEERIAYVDQQLADLKELLEDADDCKWVYNALLDNTDAKLGLQRRKLGEEAAELRSWLARLKELDAFRKGRWAHIEAELKERIESC